MMKPFLLSCITAAALLSAAHVSAQSEGTIYMSDGDFASKIKIFADGKEKTLAFAGGLTSPQYSFADLNRDGLQDMVIYEDAWYDGLNQVKTFINKGTKGNPDYRYSPEYQYTFPSRILTYMALRDYNCDNIPDLFCDASSGYGALTLHKGYYNSDNKLAFGPPVGIKYFVNSFTGWSTVSTGGSDIPCVEDVDGDGDLDMVAFDANSNGALLAYYRNVQVEEHLPCDSFKIVRETKCWGKALQGIHRKFDLGFSCVKRPGDEIEETEPVKNGGSVSKTTHGANTVCLFDADGDGDMDILNGNFQYSDIQCLYNGRVDYSHPIDSMVAQDTMWAPNCHVAYMPVFPAAKWEDADDDGIKDILLFSSEQYAENYRCSGFYKNMGTNANPNFVHKSDTFMVDKMIDMGSNSYPVLYDYDKDGKQDLFVGGRGHYQPNGIFKTRVAYFKNTSTAAGISFTLVDWNFLQLDTMAAEGAALAMGDLDNDGKDELVIGRRDGSLAYYRNEAASANVQPVWQLWQQAMTDMSGTQIASNSYAAPCIYDIDKDGKKDLLIGCGPGYIRYFKNAGNANELKLTKITDMLGGVKADSRFTSIGTSAPFIGKMDNTGKEYLLVGSESGYLYRYDGFQNGNVTTPYVMKDSIYSNINLPAFKSAPVVADLDNDGKYEMIIGNERGGLFIYRQIFNVDVEDVAGHTGNIDLYPNPASDKITISMNGIIPDDAVYKIYSSIGHLAMSGINSNHGSVIAVDIANLPAGMYICILSYNGQSRAGKFIKRN